MFNVDRNDSGNGDDDKSMDAFIDPLLPELREGKGPASRIDRATKASSMPMSAASCWLIWVDRK